MNKRVYGVLGIKSIMANWNADFTGYPKSTSSGDIFGSDKAFKFPMKKMWQQQGEKVVYIKTLKTEEVKKEGIKVVPRSLKERYEQLFEVKNLKDEKDARKVLTNLFSAIDIKNFGATFAEEGTNFSIIGAVQIGQGFNKYEASRAEEQQILSPFRDGTKDDADQSTLGTKIVSDEAHYFYPFIINPKAYDEYVVMGVTEGYTEEDYDKFKQAALTAATAFNTNSKLGCENEFALFIETEEDLYLPELAQYITFSKKEGKDCINLGIQTLIESLKSRIKTIEIYYNPLKMVIESPIQGATYYNIFTKEEVSL